MPDRLDYAVKWRYFRHLLYGGDPASVDVYRRHILARTGGDEPRSWKNTLDDYLSACQELLRSMEIDGFDGTPVRYGTNKLLIGGGAHRVACAIALGIGIHATERPKPGRMTWGELWFRQNGFAVVEIERMKADMEAMRCS